MAIEWVILSVDSFEIYQFILFEIGTETNDDQWWPNVTPKEAWTYFIQIETTCCALLLSSRTHFTLEFQRDKKIINRNLYSWFWVDSINEKDWKIENYKTDDRICVPTFHNKDFCVLTISIISFWSKQCCLITNLYAIPFNLFANFYDIFLFFK